LSSSAPEARVGCLKIEGTVSIIHAAGVPAGRQREDYLADGKVAMRWRRWRKYSGLTAGWIAASIQRAAKLQPKKWNRLIFIPTSSTANGTMSSNLTALDCRT
jgi:hypothetical protein